MYIFIGSINTSNSDPITISRNIHDSVWHSFSWILEEIKSNQRSRMFPVTNTMVVLAQ